MLYNILKDLRRRFMEPKVYALTIEGKDFVFMDLQVAYSLEEAFDQAQKEFLRLNPNFLNKPLNARIHFFCIKTLNELFHNDIALKPEMSQSSHAKTPDSVTSKPVLKNTETVTQVPIHKIKSPGEIKNDLMKKIINEKNKDLLDLNSHVFTEAELSYIVEKINNIKNK